MRFRTAISAEETAIRSGNPSLQPPAMVMIGDLPEPGGGAAMVCYHMCEELRLLGIEVHFIDTEPHRNKILPPLASYHMVRRKKFPGVRTLLVQSPRKLAESLRLFPMVSRCIGIRSALGCVLIAAEAAKVATRANAPVILTHHAGVRSVAGLMVARSMGLRLVVYAHGAEWAQPRLSGLAPITALVAKEANALIVNSRYTRDLCQANTGRQDITIGAPGVDHSRFNPGVDSRSGDELVVLFVGRLHPRKGPMVLADAIPLVKSDRPLRFIFSGPDQGEGARVRQATQDVRPGLRVEFRGPVAPEDLPQLYGIADVVVCPSESETFGLVAAEALACGIPVIASRVGALPELVVDGESGLLFDPGSASDLAEKLSILLSDRQLRRRLATAAPDHAARCSWKALGRIVLDAAV